MLTELYTKQAELMKNVYRTLYETGITNKECNRTVYLTPPNNLFLLLPQNLTE